MPADQPLICTAHIRLAHDEATLKARDPDG